tara:strand:- start:985 stop:1191 length:207 start_codon:yes stop_codon:yes gene_type:complete
MRYLEVVDGKVQLYEDEKEKMEEFVAKRNGKILWGFIGMNIEEYGVKVIEYLPWVTKHGFMVTDLKDI